RHAAGGGSCQPLITFLHRYWKIKCIGRIYPGEPSVAAQTGWRKTMARTISIFLPTLALAAFTLCTGHTGRPLADVVTDWNVIALNATALPPNSALQSRTLAIVHAAIYDATRSV